MPTGSSLSDLGDKPVSDLIDNDVKISPDGAVTGTLKYVKDWTEFSSVEEERSGHFFPITLDSKYADKLISCTRSSDGTEKKAQDLEWVLRVKDANSKFTFKEDGGEPFLTLSFTGATLQPNSVRQSARTSRKVAKPKA